MGQQVLNGIFLGSIYALFAVGYTLVFGVLDILNLAHQAVFMLAAFVALALVADAHLSLWVALPLAVVAGGLVGIGLQRLPFVPPSALGDAAGVLARLAFNPLPPDVGRGVELKGLAVIILGGMGSIPGAVIAGFALGVIEVFTVAQLGSSFRDVVSFAVLFLVLIARPRGLLGRAAAREAW